MADYQNVAPFFLDERFPESWYRRADPFTLPSALIEAVNMFMLNPREIGANEGLNNFVPLELDIESQTPAELGCFLLENFFDLAPGQLQSAVADNLDLAEGFVSGVVAPFFFGDGYFNCNFTSFVKPSSSAGVSTTGAQSSSGSPVNGSYPGIGVIEPNY